MHQQPDPALAAALQLAADGAHVHHIADGGLRCLSGHCGGPPAPADCPDCGGAGGTGHVYSDTDIDWTECDTCQPAPTGGYSLVPPLDLPEPTGWGVGIDGYDAIRPL